MPITNYSTGKNFRSTSRPAAICMRGHKADVAICLRRYSFSICASPDATQALLDAMTRFSDPDVHRCPECQGHLLWPNLKCFSSYGIKTTWSDGAAPLRGMLDGSIARLCPTCRAVLWKKDLHVLGPLTSAPRPISPLSKKLAGWFGDKHGYIRAEKEWEATPAAWKEAEHGDWLTYPDMHRALVTCLCQTRTGRFFYVDVSGGRPTTTSGDIPTVRLSPKIRSHPNSTGAQTCCG